MSSFDISLFQHRTQGLVQGQPRTEPVVRALIAQACAAAAQGVDLTSHVAKLKYREASQLVKALDCGVQVSTGAMSQVLDHANYLSAGLKVEYPDQRFDPLNAVLGVPPGTKPGLRLAMFLMDTFQDANGFTFAFTAEHAAAYREIEEWCRAPNGFIDWLEASQLVNPAPAHWRDPGMFSCLGPNGTAVRQDILTITESQLRDALVTELDAFLRAASVPEFHLPIGQASSVKTLPRKPAPASVPAPASAAPASIPDAAPASIPDFPTTPAKESPAPMNTNLDLASLMSDPSKLGEFMGSAIQKIGEIPKLVAQIKDAKDECNRTSKQLHDANTVNKGLAEDALKLAEVNEKLKLDLSDALSQASNVIVSKPGEQGKGNDLDALARALRIDRPTLDLELAAFLESCVSPLPNKVRWPAWCDPTNPASLLPFTYKHSKPVFLAGESGTGKTFLAEALAMRLDGRRCSITFHEKISYSKLFMRETVDNGKVRGVLGPVLLSMLTGTPLILDEIDHADVFVQSLMHEALDKRQVFIPELACMIKAEPTCKFIATGNSLTDDSGQYHGEVGTALRTRFAAIHVEYPNQSDEADTVRVASDCSAGHAKTIATTFSALRGACVEQKLTGPISVRESCAVGKLLVQALGDKLTEQQAMGMAMKLMVVDKRPRGEQAVACEIIQAHAGVAVSAMTTAASAT